MNTTEGIVDLAVGLVILNEAIKIRDAPKKKKKKGWLGL